MKKAIALILCLVTSFCAVLNAGAVELELSAGAEYDLITPASEAYPDNGEKLTDGIYGTFAEGTDGYYASGAYVGFNKSNINESGNFALILDLGEVKESITHFSVGYLSETEAGIHAPKTVTFAISEERNGNYEIMGVLETTPQNTAVAATYVKTLETEEKSGRYVLVTVTPAEYTGKVDSASVAPWTFIDEISVRTVTQQDSSEQSESEEPAENESSAPTEDEITPPAEDSRPPEEDMPQTGDSGMILGFVLLTAAAAAMAIALFLKRNKKQQF